MANRALESTIWYGQKGQEIGYFKKRDNDLTGQLNQGVYFLPYFFPSG